MTQLPFYSLRLAPPSGLPGGPQGALTVTRTSPAGDAATLDRAQPPIRPGALPDRAPVPAPLATERPDTATAGSILAAQIDHAPLTPAEISRTMPDPLPTSPFLKPAGG
ncbi:hypothetical protein [Sulfitobacter alexandrii]|nr:hypothetical protein [Sulfitobacter alexandrii]